jgi:hypothetical protein
MSDASAPTVAEPVAPSPSSPTIHEAFLSSNESGAVDYGAEIDVAGAVARRQAGENVVVRGDDTNENRRLAGRIEAAVGPCQRGVPHVRSAGPHALPHYQQTPRKPPAPRGHTFYETPRRKARRKR